MTNAETAAFPSLANHFLIAMPELQDPNFFKTVTLICQHDENGALGIVINRPMESLVLGDILGQLDMTTSDTNSRLDDEVYVGGPVHNEVGLVLHQDDRAWDSTIRIGNQMGLTSSRDILESMASGNGPERALLSLGYAGWGASQLESEIHQNSWLTHEADPELIFATPVKDRWSKAVQLLGVDPERLAFGAGHA